MHSRFISVLLTAVTQCAPTKTSTLNLASFTGSEPVLDQGGGIYVAAFDHSGIADVQYTPWVALQELPNPLLVNSLVAINSFSESSLQK